MDVSSLLIVAITVEAKAEQASKIGQRSIRESIIAYY
jgi:hypothetical protein